MIGGGPLNKGVGDSLASQGVAIINAYSWYVYLPIFFFYLP